MEQTNQQQPNEREKLLKELNALQVSYRGAVRWLMQVFQYRHSVQREERWDSEESAEDVQWLRDDSNDAYYETVEDIKAYREKINIIKAKLAGEIKCKTKVSLQTRKKR